MVKDMLISGVICEFNPLHNGHKYLLDAIKKETGGYTVCVMSGNFVQRGECAIIDKYRRTKMALANGADLVIELPSPFAVATAEKFAFGGVSLLDALGCCDRIYFGSESGTATELSFIAKLLKSEEFSSALSDEIRTGDNFATARENAVKKLAGSEVANMLRKPNNILGIEYIKALETLKSSIKPYTVKRIGADHDSEDKGVNASAKAIRECMLSGSAYSHMMPEDNIYYINDAVKHGEAPASLAYCERSILADLRRAKPEDLLNIPDVSEGIENKIISAARVSGTLVGLYAKIKSKRYSHARIRRIILSYYLRIDKSFNRIPYIKVLGMNRNGLDIIKSKTNTLPYVVNFSDVKKLDDYSQELFAHEAMIDDIYALMQPVVADGGKYYTTPPIIQL